mgnify:CR=1 FL=1
MDHVTEKLTRKLAVILATDCVGFSKMMDQYEELTLQNIKMCRQIIDPTIEENGGRIFHTAGDSVIAEFNSVVDAVNAGIEFQKKVRQQYKIIAKRFPDRIFTIDGSNSISSIHSTIWEKTINCINEKN